MADDAIKTITKLTTDTINKIGVIQKFFLIFKNAISLSRKNIGLPYSQTIQSGKTSQRLEDLDWPGTKRRITLSMWVKMKAKLSGATFTFTIEEFNLNISAALRARCRIN